MVCNNSFCVLENNKVGIRSQERYIQGVVRSHIRLREAERLLEKPTRVGHSAWRNFNREVLRDLCSAQLLLLAEMAE